MATTGERVRRGLRACSLALLVGSCTHDEAPDGPPVRDCTAVVWVWPSRPGASVQLEQAAKATLVGDVFDDAATGQGLLNYFQSCRCARSSRSSRVAVLTPSNSPQAARTCAASLAVASNISSNSRSSAGTDAPIAPTKVSSKIASSS